VDRRLGSWLVAKSYRPVQRDQPFLLPPDMREWLPGDHVVWFLLETVEALDTSAFHHRRRVGGVGAAGYDPDMLLTLLIYAYCQGVRSSRQIERRCLTDVAFRVLCAQDIPDHATIARFRAEHEDTFAQLFTQVLLVAAEAGLARLGTVAIDGTKIPANASIDANHSEEWLQAQVRLLVAEAQRLDAAEDAASDAAGSSDHLDNDGQRLPDRLRDRSQRTQRIRQAAHEVAEQMRRRERADRDREEVALDRRRRAEAGGPVVGRIPDGPHRLAEAKAHLAREIAAHQAKLNRHAAIVAAGGRPMGRPPVPIEQSTRVLRAERVVQAAIDAEAKAAAAGWSDEASRKHRRKPKHLPKVVANTTDPQSRIMPTRKGFLQGYNAQLAVSADHLILAVSLGQSTNDQACFTPMMHATQTIADHLHAFTGNHDHVVGTVLADAGYASDANLAAAGPDRLIALGKGRDQAKATSHEPAQGPPDPDATARQVMSHRLRTEEGKALYKRRGATVEPTIGNLKKILDRFSRRGLHAALSELQLAATACNLLKIYRAAAA
jgi:transposase